MDELPVVVDCASEFRDSIDSEEGRSGGYVIADPESSVKACELFVAVLKRELANSESFERDLVDGGLASGFAALARIVE